MRKFFLLLILFACLLPVAAYAQNANVKVGGELFAHYRYNISGYAEEDPRFLENDDNEFSIERARLNFMVNFERNFYTRIAIDGVRENQDDALREQIAYAYFAWAAHKYLNIKIGQFEEPYGNFMQNRFRFRALETTMSERFTGLDDAELGLSLSGVLPRNFGGYALYVGNGEGGESGEVDSGKAGGAVLVLTPLQGVPSLRDVGIAGTFRYEKGDVIPGPALDQRMTMGGVFFLRISRFNGGFEYLRTNYDFNADLDPLVAYGYHAFADIALFGGLGVYGRWMHWDPTSDDSLEIPSPSVSATGSGATIPMDEDATDWLNAGLFYQANDFLRLYGYYQREWYQETDVDDNTIDPEQLVGAAVDVSF